jgi:hypothetical protein
MKGWLKRTSAAITLLLGVAVGARVVYALLVPLVPVLIFALVLILVCAVALGFVRRL